MKKLVLAILAGLIGMPAFAADMPVKASPPLPAPAYGWTGFYLGANVGYSWGRSHVDTSLFGSNGLSRVQTDLGAMSPNLDGIIGGGQAGYNWQTGWIVLGLEADIQASGERGSSQLSDTLSRINVCLAPCVPPPPTPVSGSFAFSEKLDWFDTLRGRVGVLPSEGWLVFVTGGLAYGRIESSGTLNVPSGAFCLAPCTPLPTTAAASFSHMKAGWVVGAGIEAAIDRNWTGKLEYLHIDFGDTTDTITAVLATPFAGTYTITNHITDDIVRVGVNYHFH
jgi:outer membrane immunogenic protein